MPTAKAQLRYLRIAPRKVRLVADLVRGKEVAEAQTALKVARKKAAAPILKALNSAVASSKQQHQIDEHGLVVSKIVVNEGPTLKRLLPRAHGMATPLHKKMSHVVIELQAKEGAAKVVSAAAEKEEPAQRSAKTERRPASRRAERAEPRGPARRGVNAAQRMFRRKAI